ncbi:hypothetical protein LEN26_013496 [Aphanomyces euteiches]|nr:hypothetical protein LEN26_013496 [Aphanomyces euteiches]KAH9125281.1 hypothetical protein AeMF1_004076 [Aphanomyces euteiches]KAH9192751.1 hypothetical protein AeNC1_005271 [Aphanomyces euteiches]
MQFVVVETPGAATTATLNAETKPEPTKNVLGDYLRRFRGVETPPEVNPTFRPFAVEPALRSATSLDESRRRKSITVTIWSFISSFCGIAILAALQYNLHSTYASGVKVTTIIGSFGATAILTYGALQSPLAQPRNVIVGNVLSSTIGVTVFKIFRGLGDDYMWLSCALAVSLSLVVMELTDTVHPPGGASALIAVISGPDIEDLGYMYVVMPVFTGSCILVLVSVVLNNIHRQYPRYWLYKS